MFSKSRQKRPSVYTQYPSGVKSIPARASPEYYNSFLAGGFSNNDAIFEPTVLACLRVISNTVAGIPVHVFSDGKTYSTFTRGMPLDIQKVVRKPNKEETAGELYAKIACNMVFHNGAYLQFKKSKGKINSIECIPFKNVNRVFDNTLGRYKYSGSDNQNKAIISEEIVYLKGVVLDESKHLDILQNSMNLIDLSISSIDNATKYFKRAPKNAGFVVSDEKLKDEQYNRIQSRLDQINDDPDQAGSIAILEKMNFIANPFSMKDSGYNETRETSVESICQLMGVPMQLLGGADASAFKDLGEVRASFLSLTINPILVAIENAIHDACSYAFEMDFQERDFLNSAYEDRARLGKELFESGLIDSGEARKFADLNSHGVKPVRVIASNNLQFEEV
ncbi:TPA: phage portal protein [Aeromonas dhakensis]|uniref:phage portal protein n=1 Tax=Aeromonas dhakensis TaxID=196024 RepID=UPI002891FBFC|nr:phage portal protein [Aeromonas dhakensis]HDX8469017.1 phage portal protein [Aeromonas dhakensis]HDZ8869532.1 phage portal protein [Aeromonas dhakensis]HDZ8931152.1 phage portal protein [Aeromonas dhakensis]HEA3208358.1 phage portal protein [Aeromonas dhakensis]